VFDSGHAHESGAYVRRATRARAINRLLAKLEAPRARSWLVALALVLAAPSLVVGLAFDDYILLDEMARPGERWPGSAPFDLFRWTDPAHVHRLIDGQGLAFWTFDGATHAFMRPMSSLTHALDGLLWPYSATAMHLHSLIWFALLLVLVMRLYAAIMESRFVAGVSSAMFALDSAHGITVGWIANRNALIGGVFGVAALHMHHRFRSGAGARFGVLAFSFAACSLFSAELAIGLLGYVFSYALLYERGPMRRRLLSLLPYAALLGVLALARTLGHYGVYGLGAYIDPTREPFAFVAELPVRVVVLLSSQLSRINADLYEFISAPLRPLFFVAALLACVACLACVWPSLRAHRETRFLAAGALLSAIPLAACTPSDRMLTFVGIGAMPVLAAALHDALTAAERGAAALRGRVLQAGALVFALVHLTLDPLLLPLFACSPSTNARAVEAIDASLADAGALGDKTVIVTEVPDSVLVGYLPVLRAFKGESRIGKLYWLVGNATSVQLERRGANELRVSTRGGFFSDAWAERAERLPFHPSQRIELSEMSIVVVKVTADGRPAVCDFTFDRSLEASHFVWLRYAGDHLQRTRPPAQRQLSALRSESGASARPSPVPTASLAPRKCSAKNLRFRCRAPVPPLPVDRASGPPT
jgi:hypothetical protein